MNSALWQRITALERHQSALKEYIRRLEARLTSAEQQLGALSQTRPGS